MLIIDSVLNYISQDKTDYAIMINGEWGSGKTFFVKNILIPEIERIKKDDKYKVIYISLFGINSITDVSKRILLAYWSPFSLKKSKNMQALPEYAKIGIGALESITGKSLSRKDIDFLKLIKPENTIIIFDDLERTSISISIILGYINNFVEHDNIKTILISNEKELKNNEDYNKIKEKLVSKTVSYILAPEIIINSLIEEQTENTKDYTEVLMKNKELILKLLDNSSAKNFRIVRQFINDFKNIYYAYKKYCENDIEKLTSIILETTLILSLEIKSNLTEKTFFDKFKSVDEYLSYSPRTDNDILTAIKDRYFKGPQEVLFYMPSIYHFITTGIIDETQIKKDRDDIFIYNAKSEYEPYEKLLKMTWFVLADDEFESALNATYLLIKSGNLPLEYYYKAYELFKYFDKISLLNDTFLDYHSDFLLGLEKIELTRIINLRAIIEQISFEKSFNEGPEDNLSKEIESKIKEVCDKLQVIEFKYLSDSVLNYLENDIIKLGNIMDKSYDLPILNSIDIEDLFQTLSTCTNSNIRQFNMILIRRYKMNPRIKHMEKMFIDGYISYVEQNQEFSLIKKVSHTLIIMLKENLKANHLT